MPNIEIKNATTEDLESIIKIDHERYGVISKKVTASREMMKKRINISKDWFFVAIVNGEILGYLSLQPTNETVDEFVSWEHSTDNGTLEKTYSEKGKNIYGVALTISNKAKGMGLSDLLMLEAAKKIIKENKKIVLFSGRMPGYVNYQKDMSAEEYYNAKITKNGKSVALDPQIRMYESFGLKRVRLVEDGFDGDKESGNYSVLFYAKNVFYNWPFRNFIAKVIGKIAENPKIFKLIVG